MQMVNLNMNILTPYGYKNISDVNIGDELLSYDTYTGEQIINILLNKELWLPSVDEEHLSNHGNFISYKLNDLYVFYKNQSIWSNGRVQHVNELKVNDIVYDDANKDIIINSIEELDGVEWWRLEVSGDHSFISDGLILHNASRYWVGGGSSVNWNATGNTNWGSASGVTDNSSVPTSADDVIFDGAGTSGNTNSTISTATTILSLNITTGYTATMTHNGTLTIAGNWTYTSGYTIAGSSGITISATSTIRSNGVTWPNSLAFTNINTKTLLGNLTVSGSMSISVPSSFNVSRVNATSTETLTLLNGLGLGYATYVAGTAKFIYVGGSINTSDINNNLYGVANNQDISGSVTIGTIGLGYTGNLTYGTFRYVTGTLDTGSAQLVIGNRMYIDVGNAITFTNASSNQGLLYLLSDVYISNELRLTSSGGILNLNSNGPNRNVYLKSYAPLINSSNNTLRTTDGSVTLIFTGGGIIRYPNNTVTVPFVISGDTTPVSINNFGGSSFTHITGSFLSQSINPSITFIGSTILNTPSITWNNITINGATLNLSSSLPISGNLTIAGGVNAFTGSNGWSCRNLVSTATSAATMSLAPNNIYYVTSSFTVNTARAGSNILIQSNNATTRSVLILPNGATCNTNANFTRIDASSGRTINSFNSIITDCLNIQSFTDKKVVGGSV